MKVSPILCDNCTGCGSCSAVCMKNAIEIRLNERGFYTPFVNLDKCVGCGQCTKFCSTDGARNSVLKAFAVRHKDLNVVTQSRSGGFFYAVSDYIISEKKGVVYGCCLTGTYDVRHIRVTVLDDLKKLQGSKYTQSYIDGELYQKAINDVKNGLSSIYFADLIDQCNRYKTGITRKLLLNSVLSISLFMLCVLLIISITRLECMINSREMMSKKICGYSIISRNIVIIMINLFIIFIAFVTNFIIYKMYGIFPLFQLCLVTVCFFVFDTLVFLISMMATEQKNAILYSLTNLQVLLMTEMQMLL